MKSLGCSFPAGQLVGLRVERVEQGGLGLGREREVVREGCAKYQRVKGAG